MGDEALEHHAKPGAQNVFSDVVMKVLMFISRTRERG